MNTILMIIQLLGGLAMFLYGMEIMSDGLKQGSGEALKKFLGKLTQNALLGVLTGTIVTAIIQSSTATIVLTVGLIGAGILNMRQAVSIVLGANIGTTITAQIIRLMDLETGGNTILVFFKPDTLAPIALILGIIFIMFLKTDRLKNGGLIAMGFGVLFTGLLSMTAAVEPLAESELFRNALATVASRPLLGIVVGLVLTVIVQSSSAMVGILQALSSTGAMTFNLVYPVIMGINLGTCVTTAMVCSIGTGKDAKRTGIVHIVFNTVGTVLFMVAMTLLKNGGVWPQLWDSIVDSGVIANFQTLFNLITAIVLLPFTGLLMGIACKIIKDDPVKESKYPELEGLDEKLMISPALALAEAARHVAVMARAAKENMDLGMAQFKGYDPLRTLEINETEDQLDRFADTADNYLIELSRSIDNPRDKHLLNTLMQCIPNIERVGDYATNFDEMAKKMYDEKLVFSEVAQKELDILSDAIQEILRLTVDALVYDSDATACRIEPLEEVIDDMVLLLKDRHTLRLCNGVCSINTGLVFMESLTYLERAADQCSSIAMLIMAKNNEAILSNHHEYLRTLHESGDQNYLAEQENRRQQYLTALENLQ